MWTPFCASYPVLYSLLAPFRMASHPHNICVCCLCCAYVKWNFRFCIHNQNKKERKILLLRLTYALPTNAPLDPRAQWLTVCHQNYVYAVVAPVGYFLLAHIGVIVAVLLIRHINYCKTAVWEIFGNILLWHFLLFGKRKYINSKVWIGWPSRASSSKGNNARL